MNQLSYYVTKRLIVGSKDSSGTIIHFRLIVDSVDLFAGLLIQFISLTANEIKLHQSNNNSKQLKPNSTTIFNLGQTSIFVSIGTTIHSVPAIMHRDASYSSFTVLVRY